MRVAYADPPYVGQSRTHYDSAEVNHRLLIAHLCDEFSDGWALSCSSPSLRHLLPMCPEDVRIGAWVKPFAILKPNVNPAYCWEPVIWRGGRKRVRETTTLPGELVTIRDFVRANVTIERGLSGVKPQAFCFWIFDLLNVQPGDELVDLFPGSGAVSDAWKRYAERLPFEVT